MIIGHGSDLHFDSVVGTTGFEEWLQSLKTPEAKLDILVLTGDISTGKRLISDLRALEATVKCPVYFVTGNHDKYYSSFSKINEKVAKFSQSRDGLLWLGHKNTVITLGEDIALVGEDGWYDTRCGIPPLYNKISLSDWDCITDFVNIPDIDYPEKFRSLADKSSVKMMLKLNQAVKAGFKKILVATHFPPFPYDRPGRDKEEDAHWRTWSVNSTMGEVLAKFAEMNPEVMVEVWCGHTHYSSRYWHLPNLRMSMNEAELGSPKIYAIDTATLFLPP